MTAVRAWLIVLLAVSVGCTSLRPSTPAPSGFDRRSVDVTGTARIDDASGASPMLVVVAHLHNLGDTTVVIESAQSNCEPALELLEVATGRRFMWSHAAWRSHHEILSPRPLDAVVCIGTGLLVGLPPRATGEIGRQAYSVSMIRGDSVPAGQYRVGIPVLVSTVLNGFNRDDTLRVWSSLVTLR